MSINLINNGLGPSGSNFARSISKLPTSYARNRVEPDGIGSQFSPSGEFNRLNPSYLGWSLSTGSVIDTNGSLLFNSNIFGGSLDQLVVVNRSSGDVYIGFNSTTPAYSSGLMLSSGESYTLNDGIINRFWAITRSGQSIIQAFGTRYFNSNTI
jgi:hypothetical protein